MSNQDFYGSGHQNYGQAPAYGGTPQHDPYAQQQPGPYGQAGSRSPYPQQQNPYPPQGHDQSYSAPPAQHDPYAQQQQGPYGQVAQSGYQQPGAYDDRSGHSPYPPQQGVYGAPTDQYGAPGAGAYGQQQQAPPVIGPDGQPIPADGERGLGRMAMGAMGGGLLGHQAGGHGGLGAIGGAIAAQMLGGSDKYAHVLASLHLRMR